MAAQDAAAAEAAPRVELLKEQGANARQLNAVAGDTPAQRIDPLSEEVTPGDIAYRQRGLADLGVKLWRNIGRLSETEAEAAVRVLTSKDPATRSRLLEGLLKKYPNVKRAIAPALARPAVGQGDETAVETLEEDYGLTP